MNIFKRLKLGKLVTMYAIVDTEDNNMLYTIVRNKNQAIEYINKILKNLHINHYSSWCKIHNKDDNMDSWNEYAQTVIQDEFSSFSVLKMRYTLEAVASMFRIANGCIPQQCSYESKFEQEIYKTDLEDTETSLEKFK